MSVKWVLRDKIRNILRRLFKQSPWYSQAARRAQVKRPRYKQDGSRHKVDMSLYKCDQCGVETKITNINIDHIDPIGPAPGSKYARPDATWDEFIRRVFCSLENLRAICTSCHKAKTKVERKQLGRLSKELRPPRKRPPPDSN